MTLKGKMHKSNDLPDNRLIEEYGISTKEVKASRFREDYTTLTDSDLKIKKYPPHYQGD